jgi:threonyl-tRNA synthetase
LHRAILGSIERFVGILIEEHAGSFPAWLAPNQVVVMCITDRQAEYARKIENTLRNRGIRVKLDLRNEKIGFKIREHTMQKVPYLVILGDREQNESTLAVRSRSGTDLGSMSLDTFAQDLLREIASHGRYCLEV